MTGTGADAAAAVASRGSIKFLQIIIKGKVDERVISSRGRPTQTQKEPHEIINILWMS